MTRRTSWPALALLALTGVVFVTLALVGWPVVADAAPASPSGAAIASRPADPSTTTAGSASSLTVKLAPGFRLVEKGDGTLSVMQDWEPSPTAELRAPGLALRETGGLEKLGIRVLEAAPEDGFDSGEDIDLEAAARQLRLMRGVLWAEVSAPVYACLVPNDPLYPPSNYSSVGQWGPKRVGLPEAWDTTTGSADVIVAVIDTGINQSISGFSGRIVAPYDVITRSTEWPAYEDHEGHGTAVAGVAVARGNDGRAIAGAAWNVSIMPVKISESGASNTDVLAKGIIHATDNGADVLNISFCGPESTQTLSAAVAYAVARGVVIVAAAGNGKSDPVGYPAALPDVIAVGATDGSDGRWVDSDLASATGNDLDVMAPGKSIISYKDAMSDSFGHYRGTSLASPLVAGVAALVRSVDPTLTPQQVADVLASSADDLGAAGWDEEYGWGLLDAEEAVVQAVEGTVTTTTTTTEPPTTTTTTEPTTTTTTTVSTTTTTTQPRFADVTADSTPYWEEIEVIATLGIVSGMGDGLFRPEDALLRQQFAKIIVLALGYPVTTADICPFGDVAKSSGQELYPDHYVAVAYREGITNGTTPNHFSPYRTLNRAQMITMVARAASLAEPPVGYTPPFSNFSSVHYPSARAASYSGLLDGLVGMGATYDFLAPASRGEVCALIYALLM